MGVSDGSTYGRGHSKKGGKKMNKRIISIFMSGFLALGLTACGNAQASDVRENTQAQTSTAAETEQNTETKGEESSVETGTEQTADGKSLVVYFSVPETTNADNMSAEEEYSTVVIDGEVFGNTQYVAHVVQENTGADIFRIEPVTPYPMDHAKLELFRTV